jgi:hypothetical protein
MREMTNDNEYPKSGFRIRWLWQLECAEMVVRVTDQTRFGSFFNCISLHSIDGVLEIVTPTMRRVDEMGERRIFAQRCSP